MPSSHIWKKHLFRGKKKRKRKRGKPVQRKVLSKKNTPTGLLYLCASDIISHNFTVRCCSGSWIYLSQDHRHDSTMYHLSKHVGTVTIWPHRSRIIKTFIFYFLLSYGILKFQIIWCWSIAALSVWITPLGSIKMPGFENICAFQSVELHRGMQLRISISILSTKSAC